MNFSKLGWYWHRLQAMSPSEVLLRLQKKSHQFADRHYRPRQPIALDSENRFPKLPKKAAAPSEFLAALRRDVADILSGRWRAFGHLPMALKDPPQWHSDNLIGRDLESKQIAFKLDHRAQPGGADIKVIWEPNRWYQLVRLAMAAWLLDNTKAQEKCIEWLHDWATRNPAFTGLNWTSGLETGIRLIQFTWIDALLTAAGVPQKTLLELRGRILPPHIWYTWRYKSFGSSANNHLIGELAGLIIAQARWPELSKLSAPLLKIGPLLENEILKQFAEDGGNEEQALGYHLFSWEFCFQSTEALESAGQPLSREASERIAKAGIFYHDLKPKADTWDFGDSDNAWVTPLFAHEEKAAEEWWSWFENDSAALEFWWGKFHVARNATPDGEWQVFANSGYAVLRQNDWFLRLDFSSLGYLSMAPHGHLDALHLSVWHRGKPVIIDPGTGAYYAEKRVRNFLAGWAAHNGPRPKGTNEEYPKRFGTFLWATHHARPTFAQDNPRTIRAEIDLPWGRASRTVTFDAETREIKVADRLTRNGAAVPFATRWKFAPGLQIERNSPNSFTAGSVRLEFQHANVSRIFNPPIEWRDNLTYSLPDQPIESIVSPAFRALTAAAYIDAESAGVAPGELILSAG